MLPEAIQERRDSNYFTEFQRKLVEMGQSVKLTQMSVLSLTTMLSKSWEHEDAWPALLRKENK